MNTDHILASSVEGPERRAWYDALWQDVVALEARYAPLQGSIRPGWWMRPAEREALAALCTWRRVLDADDTEPLLPPEDRARRAWDYLRTLPHAAHYLAHQPATHGAFDPTHERATFEAWLTSPKSETC